MMSDGALAPKMQKVVDRCIKKKGHYAGTELLVQWEGTSEDDAVWVDVEELRAKYPELEGEFF